MIPGSYRSLEDKQPENKWNGIIWLIFSAAAVGLGNSLEPISAFVLFHPFLLIVGFEKLFNQISRAGYVLSGYECDLPITCILTALIQAVGMTFGFAGLYGFPTNTFFTVFASFVTSCLWWLVMVCLTMVPLHFVLTKYPSWILAPLVFPICHSAASVSVLGELVGTFGCIGNAVLDIASLVPLASIFGVAAIEFIALLPGSVSALFFLDPARQHFQRTCLAVGCFMLSVLALGGYLATADSFYQRDSSELVPHTSIPASCILAQVQQRMRVARSSATNRQTRTTHAYRHAPARGRTRAHPFPHTVTLTCTHVCAHMHTVTFTCTRMRQRR